MVIDTRLFELLRNGTQFDPHYLPDMNSDHLPMTLCAMTGLGAGMPDLLLYRAHYVTRLRPEVQGAPLQDWRTGIGREACYAPLRRYFANEIARTSVADTVRCYLPEFFPSLAQQAFHAVIRLAYAIDFDSPEETAAALAYIVASHIETPTDPTRSIDIRSQMHSQAQAPSLDFSTERFAGRIRQLIDQEAYPQGQAASIDDCAAVALDVYRSTRNFFALHMVTATQATRICLPYLDETQAVAALTSALLAAHLCVGSPEFDQDKVLPIRSLDDEHDYKYAWSCLSEYRRYGNPLYRKELQAAQAARMLPSWADATLERLT